MLLQKLSRLELWGSVPHATNVHTGAGKTETSFRPRSRLYKNGILGPAKLPVGGFCLSGVPVLTSSPHSAGSYSRVTSEVGKSQAITAEGTWSNSVRVILKVISGRTMSSALA